MLICPHCGEPLVRESNVFRCSSGHSYDIARAGYCNLLQSSRSGDQTGDNREMVAARRQFLDRGYYSSLAQGLCESVLQYASKPVHFVDAGCGEGYYTRQMAKTLAQNKRLRESIGMDISKSATQYAAKRDVYTQYVTGSVYHMPIAAKSADIICSIFAPTPAKEFSRVLHDDGVVICVAPGAEHLWELKCEVYDTPYENQEDKHVLDGFTRIEQKKITRMIHLDNAQDIQTLFSMTPYRHRTSRAGLARLSALQKLNVTTSFLLQVYQKCTGR